MGNCISSSNSLRSSVTIRNSSTTSLNDLSDDELTLIFLKLPLKSVHRSKCVCKRWLSLISHPHFAKSYRRAHQNKLINYLVLHNYDYTGPHGTRRYFASLYCLNNQHHLIDNNIQNPQIVTYDFIPYIRAQYGNAFILGLVSVQNGLMLLEADNEEQKVLYLCNPINKQWLQINVLVHSERHDCADFMWEEQEESNCISTYTIVRMWLAGKRGETACFDIDVYFSSNDGNWNEYHVPKPLEFRSKEKFHTQMVVVNGKFHWGGTNCIVAYDPKEDPKNCKVINLPQYSSYPVRGNFVLVSFKGRLRILVPYGRWSVVWVLMDYDNMDSWSMRYVVDYCTTPRDLYGFAFSESNEDEAYFIKRRRMSSINLLNMKTTNGSGRAIFRLHGHNWCLDKVAPLTISAWPTQLYAR